MKRILLLSVGLAACAAGSGASPTKPDATPREAATCNPLRIIDSVRVATGDAWLVHATGGSGHATFSLEGNAQGARIELGGGLHAGDHAAKLTVVARDVLCQSETRAPVEIIGPFVVEPPSIVLPPDGKLDVSSTGAVGPVHFALLDTSRSATVDAHGHFSAGSAFGSHIIVARDTASGKEARVAVAVGTPVPLRARTEIVALPAGARARLDFRGGSSRVEPLSVTGPTNGRVILRDGDAWFDATSAHPGTAHVVVRDRFTQETANVRVVVGESLGAPTVARGSQSQTGAMTSGDFDGDGKPDLVVGHTERSKSALDAGGVLFFYGKNGFGSRDADAIIEGANPGDQFGAALAVGDIDADGIDDLVAGVPSGDLGDSDRGAVSIFRGSKTGITTTPERIVVGESRFNQFGYAVALGDLDGDRSLDLVVTAPGARSSFQPTCDGGRIYVYRNQLGIGAVPSQVIDIRAPLADGATVPISCSPTVLGGGRALALMDLDADGKMDIVVGAPVASFPIPGRSQGVVLVYRGLGGGKIEAEPAYAIMLEPARRVDNAQFGASLDVIRDKTGGPPVLVVRAPTFSAPGLASAGALWTFAPGSLGALAPHQVRVATTSVARAWFVGDKAYAAVGRGATLGDFDPRPGNEYVVGETAPGGVFAFSASQLISGAGAQTPFAHLTGRVSDLHGFRVATVGDQLAIWAPWRTTKEGPFIGAIDFVAAGTTSLADRWPHQGTIELKNFAASDRAGTSVALASFDGKATAAIVGAPGAASPAHNEHKAGEKLRTGSVDVFGSDVVAPIARLSADRTEAQIGSIPPVILDFDGDGKLDIAVADSIETWGGIAPAGFADPDLCVALDAKKAPLNVGARGVVRIYSMVDGSLKETFRLTAPKEERRDEAGLPPYQRGRFGAALSAADVNGDGKDDVIVGRPGGRDASGAEVVLGRARDAGGKVLVACNTGATGKMGALVMPSASVVDPTSFGVAVARLGDIDKDGCDEVALSITTGAIPGASARAGVAIAFGYDAGGARCHGHKDPFVLRLVPDDHPLANDLPGDAKTRLDDLNDSKVPSQMGRVLASGSGDLTGDGIPDLVFRDTDLPFKEERGPAAEIISGAWIAGLCPGHICPRGHIGPMFSDGDWHVAGIRTLPPATRRIAPSNGIYLGFAAALTIADISGDGIADLAIGALDDSSQGPFAGVVHVYKGGAAMTETALLGDPWLVAVGDIAERASFGAALAGYRRKGESTTTLLVGAPTSSRNHSGGNVGTAYRFLIDPEHP